MPSEMTWPGTELEGYLRRLRWALSPLPSEEREEILRETRSHFLERIAGGDPQARFRETAAALGDPEDYAQGFLDGYRLAAAVADGSGPVMFRQALRLASRGIGAFFGTLGLLFIFLLAAAHLALAVLKPIFPENVGAWLEGGRRLSLGFMSPPPGPDVPELLGYWIIPVALLLSIGLYRLGVILLRHLLRSYLRRLS